MRHRLWLQMLLCGLALGFPARAVAGPMYTVAAGYDLYAILPGTEISGVAFQGVPLETYNFGGQIGKQNVGRTDTIYQRLAAITQPGGGTGSAKIQVDALQIVSTEKTDVFDPTAPAAFYYLTLSATKASTGTINITFNANGTGGTYGVSLDLFYDIRSGGLMGKIVSSGDVMINTKDTSWGRYPPKNTPLINGVNNFLNGKNHDQDFFLNGATTPEPSSWIMLGTASLVVPAYAGWRRRCSRNCE
jgi:hypothetical protein